MAVVSPGVWSRRTTTRTLSFSVASTGTMFPSCSRRSPFGRQRSGGWRSIISGGRRQSHACLIRDFIDLRLGGIISIKLLASRYALVLLLLIHLMPLVLGDEISKQTEIEWTLLYILLIPLAIGVCLGCCHAFLTNEDDRRQNGGLPECGTCLSKCITETCAVVCSSFCQ